MAGVLVFADCSGAEPTPETVSALAAAGLLARALDEPVLAAVVGANLDAIARHLQHHASRVYVAEGETHAHYNGEARVAAAAAIVAAAAPTIAIFTHTLQTREWVPRLAARLKTGLASDCIALALEGRSLIAQKPVYGGGAIGTYVVHGKPALATLRPGAFDVPTLPEAAGEIVRVETPRLAPRITVIEELTATSDGAPRLKDAKRIVSGGRGVGGPENWHYIVEAAAALDAAVGCSRPVADAGWVPSSHQVGLSGTSVAPDLYVAVGISGAVQHLAGIAAARTVVAINSDSDAEIFTRASYGVVGDFREVLPAFVERVRQFRS